MVCLKSNKSTNLLISRVSILLFNLNRLDWEVLYVSFIRKKYINVKSHIWYIFGYSSNVDDEDDERIWMSLSSSMCRDEIITKNCTNLPIHTTLYLIVFVESLNDIISSLKKRINLASPNSSSPLTQKHRLFLGLVVVHPLY